MNKKFKKALYMFGFALPIVAIPIITVACGTQTSQNIQKEIDKNQNEQTPKQETPIKDENKKVVLSSSLSSSKIYDENLLNSNVMELIKLMKQKEFEKAVENILEKAMDNTEEVDLITPLKKLENAVSIEEFKENVKKAISKAKSSIPEVKEIFTEIKNKSYEKFMYLYKKIFLIESSEGIDFSELKYNDFLSKFPEIKLFNFFNIENLKKHFQNLSEDNKLSEIRLKDIFITNINSVIESLKKDKSENIKLLDFKKEQENKIIELLNKDNPELSNKIKDKLSNLTNFESFESLLNDLIFSDLFDINKLQEKLNQ